MNVLKKFKWLKERSTHVQRIWTPLPIYSLSCWAHRVMLVFISTLVPAWCAF